MGRPQQAPHLTAIEQSRFCDEGMLPGRIRQRWLSLPPDERAKRKLDLFQNVCPCPTPAAEPAWVGRLRQQLAGPGGADFFPNIMANEGIAAYDAAMEALTDYRRHHKQHFRLWKPVYRAVQKSSLGKDPETNTKCIVYHSEREWNEFLHGLSSQVAKKLRDEVRDRAAGAGMSAMGAKEKMFVRFKALTGVLDRIGALNMILEGVQEQELCELPDDHPEVVARKEDYFLGLLADGPEDHQRLRRIYQAYDEAHWELLEYARRESAYRSGSRSAGHDQWHAEGDRTIDLRLPADQGLHR